MKNEAGHITLLTVIFIGLLIFMCHFYYIFATSLLMIRVFQHFSGLYPPALSTHLWFVMCTDTENMSCASAFASLKGNQAIEPFKVYLDRLVVEDMHFNSYVDHCET